VKDSAIPVARRFSPPIKARHASQAVERVHVVFKTHLDIGFSDLAEAVVAKYLNEYIPGAIALSEQMRRSDPEPATSSGTAGVGFIWTTGSWLIYQYLEWADSAGRKRMEAAIARGDVAWHALPFSTFSENMDASLFRFGLSLSQTLDQRFGKHTIAGKMTDVPGHTRSIVPLLAEAGVQFLHVGVNAASTPPDVPPLFVWRDPGSESEVVVMYHGNYGDVMVVPGLADVLAFAHTDDNVGPQTIDQVKDTFRELQLQFPGAQILVSTMDSFAASLPSIRDTLPVITQEIGDTWIYGVGSDPQKGSQYRALLRMRRDLLESGSSADELEGLSSNLLLVPEHTNGLDVKTHLKDWKNYSVVDFGAVRGQAAYRKMEASWQEQRDYVRAAVDALPASLKSEAEERLARLTPERPDLSEYEPVPDLSKPFETGQFRVAFDPELGCLTRLEFAGVDWSGPTNPLGKFWYETFSAADYDRFRRQYLINKRTTSWYAVPDFTKPGIQSVAIEHKVFLPRVTWAGRAARDDSDVFLFVLKMPPDASEEFGSPRQLTLEMAFSRSEPQIGFTLQWFDKPASRLPEASWFSFVLSDRGPDWRRSWRMDKLGQWISPYEVIRNGNRRLHAVGAGLKAEDSRHKVTVESLDAALVAPGRPTLLDFNNRQPDLREGLHFNLHNNLWGTDFPQWYDDDALFRFSLRFSRPERPPQGGDPGARRPRRRR
jgi:uncharacterized protein DUF5054